MNLMAAMLLVTTTGSPSAHDDHNFHKPLERYEALVKHQVFGLQIMFKPALSQSTALAACVAGPYPTIYVDPQWWMGSSDTEKDVVLFHELGHCDLGRGHRTDMRSDNPKCPSSLMYPVTLSMECYLKYKTDYNTELSNKH